MLSFLPKPTLPKEEEGFTHQDSADPYDGSWGENRIQYPAVWPEHGWLPMPIHSTLILFFSLVISKFLLKGLPPPIIQVKYTIEKKK